MTTEVEKLTLPESEIEAIKAIIRDDLKYIRAFIQVPNKQDGGPRLPFNPWPVQLKLLERLTHRDLVIKDSQVGCTSILSALIAKWTLTVPDTTSVIVAHEGFLTERLLNRVQFFIDSIPKEVKPEQDHSSTKEMTFPDINSTIYVGTARAQVFGRGEPIQHLLLSEEAFYLAEAWEKIMNPAITRVPETGHVFRESTPNGESGSFYDEVEAAQKGESVYRLHMLFWWENPDNTMKDDSPLLAEQPNLVKVGTLTPEEQVGAREHGWTTDQIRWRRFHLLASGVMFFQEHLESLATCFLTIGQPYYDPQRTVALSRDCFDAPFVGPEGLRVWYKPERGGYYTIGEDPGQGKITESVAQVWRWDLPEGPRHEATLAEFSEPETMAPKCVEIDNYYGGNCLHVPEGNSHGIGLIRRLREAKRLRIYMRKNLTTDKPGTHLGWYTSGSTKPFMMQEMKRRLPELITHDAEFVRQLRGFRELEFGKVGVTTADDYHDAGCLAMVGGLEYRPHKVRGYRGRSGWKAGWGERK